MRFHNRRKFDELVKPILSLDLIKQFYRKKPDELRSKLRVLPDTFEDHV